MRIKYYTIVLLTNLCLFFMACGENENGENGNPISPTQTSSENVSSSSEEVESSSSIAIVSSSSEEKKSSSSIAIVSSSSEEVESSSSIAIVSSSSEEKKSSSSIAIVSSSSEEKKSSSSIAIVSSSSEEKKSSSSIATVSSSSEKAESSSNDTESSSSEYYKASWDALNSNVIYDTIIDPRDEQVYKIITIGNQTWFAENLNYYDTIQNPELKLHSWCYNDIESNCAIYGRLYDNPAAVGYDSTMTGLRQLYQKGDPPLYDTLHTQGLCPDGWRLPTRTDFFTLTNKYTLSQLKSKKWSGANSSGFSVIKAGWLRTGEKYESGTIFVLASYCSASSGGAIQFENDYIPSTVGVAIKFGQSVRCIKDN